VTAKQSRSIKQQILPLPDGGLTRATGLNDWGGHTREGVRWEVLRGDVRSVLKDLEENRFDCAVTSPPYYWLRDYQVEGQIGLESSIDGYVKAIADSMDGVRRVLKKSGVLFLNISDTYYSAKGKPGPEIWSPRC
jgi:DNA modification methylase